MARGADLDFVHVRWIKGHVNYLVPAHGGGLSRVNLCWRRIFIPFRQGWRCSLPTDAPVVHQPVAFGTIQLLGPPSFLAIGEDIHPVVCHQGFARSLLNWMREIRWTPSASVDGLDVSQDTSSLEMFWGYVHDTSALPAFLH